MRLFGVLGNGFTNKDRPHAYALPYDLEFAAGWVEIPEVDESGNPWRGASPDTLAYWEGRSS